jgi:hypothetical protein
VSLPAPCVGYAAAVASAGQAPSLSYCVWPPWPPWPRSVNDVELRSSPRPSCCSADC